MMGPPMCGAPAVAWPAATPMIPNPSPQPPLSATINAAIADIIAKPRVRLFWLCSVWVSRARGALSVAALFMTSKFIFSDPCLMLETWG